MKYSLYVEKKTEYKRDENGNVVYVKNGNKQVPIEREVPAHYSDPISFKASIAMSGGEAEAVEFGIDVSKYSAVITTPNGMLPLTETSIIWHTKEPSYKKNGNIDESSAEYKVVKVSSSINFDRFVLEKRVNNVAKN